MIIKFCLIGNSLGTRQLGEKIRENIICSINNNDDIILDFDKVNVVANSFADECFGKLVEEFGINFLRDRIKFINMDSFVSLVIKKSILDRNDRHNSELCCTTI